MLGEPAKALAAYSHAEQLYLRTGDELGLARTLNNRGVLARQLGLYQEALDFYGRALALFEKLGERRWRARRAGQPGPALRRAGRRRAGPPAPRAGARRLARAGRPGRRVGRPGAARPPVRPFGDPAKAAENYRLALAIDRQREDRRDLALSLAGLAGALADGGDPLAALPLFGESVGLLRADGDRANLPYVLCKQGQAAAAAGKPEPAAASLGEALELAQASGPPLAEVCAEKERAALLARQGDLAGAQEHLEAALRAADGLRRELVSPDLRASYSRIEREAHEQNVALFDDPAAGRPGRRLRQPGARGQRTGPRPHLRRAAGRGARRPARHRLRPRRRPGWPRRCSGWRPKRAGAGRRRPEKALLESEMLEIEREIDRLEAKPAKKIRAGPRSSGRRPCRQRRCAGCSTRTPCCWSISWPRSAASCSGSTSDTVEGFELAPRRMIEAAARRFYQELASPGREAPAAGAEVAAAGARSAGRPA